MAVIAVDASAIYAADVVAAAWITASDLAAAPLNDPADWLSVGASVAVWTSAAVAARLRAAAKWVLAAVAARLWAADVAKWVPAAVAVRLWAAAVQSASAASSALAARNS